VELIAGINIAALEVVQEVLARILDTTIICQKIAVQMNAELTAVIIVKTMMFIIREFVFGEDV
jgi:hypothetical protein